MLRSLDWGLEFAVLSRMWTNLALPHPILSSQVSDVAASTITPPPPRVILTPRSAEACLKHGINPEVLRIRDLDSFWEPKIEPEIQRMRHETYGRRRHEMMKIGRTERRVSFQPTMTLIEGDH